MKRNEGRECWRVKGLLLFNCKSTRPSINHSENKIKICKTTKEELLIFTSPASALPPTDSSTPRTTPLCKLKLPRYVSASPLLTLCSGWRKWQDDRHQEHYYRPRWFHAPERWGRRLPQQTLRWQGPPQLPSLKTIERRLPPSCLHLILPNGSTLLPYTRWSDLCFPGHWVRAGARSGEQFRCDQQPTKVLSLMRVQIPLICD